MLHRAEIEINYYNRTINIIQLVLVYANKSVVEYECGQPMCATIPRQSN